MDETYQNYLNRVARLIRPANQRSQLENIQESPKFKEGKVQPFPGYSVTNLPAAEDDEENQAFYNFLQSYQQQLVDKLPEGLIVPVPPESFHLTLADLIWDSSFRDAVEENETFESQLKSSIEVSFSQYKQAQFDSRHLLWQLLGLAIRPRAIFVALVPQDEASYRRVLTLRRSIYQNSQLINLGVEQQYLFTAHITLGYFGKISSGLDKESLAATLASLDEQWLENELPTLTVKQGQLRKFDDMTRFYREADFPALEF